MARCSPTPTSAALIPSNPTQGAWEPARGCSSSALPPPASRTAHPQQHRLPSVPSTHSELINKANFRIKFCFVFGVFSERGSRSPRQPCMGTSWWRHWAKLGVCCWLSLDCCINLSALQCSATSLPLLFSLPPFSCSLLSTSLLHSHPGAWQWNELGGVNIKWGAGPYIVYMCRW